MTAAHPQPELDDPHAGFTLVELCVAMLLLGIVLVMAMGMFQTAFGEQSRSATLQQSQAAVAGAFISLDRQVRYASTVDCPLGWTTSTAPCDGTQQARTYTSAPSGADAVTFYSGYDATCTELLYNTSTGTLEEQTWPVTQSAPATPSWTVLAAGLSTSPGTPPFSFPPSGRTVDNQQLTITLLAANTTALNAVSSQASVTFTAVNSTSSQPPSVPVCTS
ncbi:MAG: prepilin-type N-terminal cleavage/methylation domain-containing protein [Actinomycetota bacterium]|nr:prepilin-type N-terminal cleavage/methylation domain-containing protein [Actinomycetota bacterium]